MKKLELYDYQKDSVKFIIEHKKCILRLDTGLGKTAVCIRAAEECPEVAKILVICPAFLKINWMNEIKMWGGRKKYYVRSYNYMLKTDTGFKQENKTDSKLNAIQRALKLKFDMVICDEAHYLKNWSAGRTKKICKELLPKVKRVVFSTATPFVRSAADLHPLFSVIQPGRWGTIGKFQERYCLKKLNPFKKWGRFPAMDYYGADPLHAHELKAAASAFMIKYKKADVLKSLPSKQISKIYIPPSAKFKMESLDLEEYFDIDTGKMVGGMHRVLSSACRELGEYKAKYVVEFAESIDLEASFVVFSRHKNVAMNIGKELDCPVITGETSMDKRSAIVDQFQQNKLRIISATIGAAGVGINLTAASIALFAELPWSGAELKQCEDRILRLTTTHKSINIYHFLMPGSVDDLISKVLERKSDGEAVSIGGI